MLRKIKIRKRLLLISLAMLVVTLLVVIMGHRGLNKVNALVSFMYEANLKPSVAIADLKADFMGARGTLLAMMNETVRTRQEGLHNQVKDFSNRIDNSLVNLLKSEHIGSEEKGKITELKDAWEEFRDTRDKKLIPFIYDGDLDSARGLAVGIQGERFKKMTSLSNELANKMGEDAIRGKEDADRISSNALSFLWWVSIAGIVIAGVLNILIGLSITTPIQTVIDSLKDIATGEGDLTRRLKIESMDEVGELSQWFNTFIEKVHDIIVQVNERSFKVASSSEELSASAIQIAKGTTSQTERATAVAASSEEMSATVIEVAKNASGASESAKDANKIAQKGKDMVERTVRGMNDIASAVKESASVITKLGTRSSEIGEIIKVIDDIADQTNLLALNAAIEAARAGEHGRGFAVVADEVRKLAEKTTKATKEIGGMISTIQDETGKAVQSMGAVTKEVEEEVKLAKDAGSALNEIVSNVDKLTGLIQQIAVASEEQSAATDTISRDIQDIANTTKETATGSNQIANASNDLSKLASELQVMLSKFKVRKGGESVTVSV